MRVFGCACYPTFRDYASSKFDPRSLKCVFLGYNEKYKGFRLLYPTNGKVYINYQVIFDESVFPFATMIEQTGNEKPLFSAWQQSFSFERTYIVPESSDISKRSVMSSASTDNVSSASSGVAPQVSLQPEQIRTIFTPQSFPRLPPITSSLISSSSASSLNSDRVTSPAGT